MICIAAGIDSLVPYYDYALDMVLDIDANDMASDDQQVDTLSSL